LTTLLFALLQDGRTQASPTHLHGGNDLEWYEMLWGDVASSRLSCICSLQDEFDHLNNYF
jgi:hypothetical protein